MSTGVHGDDNRQRLGSEGRMSCEEEDTCMSCEEEDTCMSCEEEDTCLGSEGRGGQLHDDMRQEIKQGCVVHLHARKGK